MGKIVVEKILNEVKNDKNNKPNKTQGPMASIATCVSCEVNANSTFEPSSGGIGIKLNTAKSKLISTIICKTDII